MSASQLAAWGVRNQRPNQRLPPECRRKQVGSKGPGPPLQTVLREHPGDSDTADLGKAAVTPIDLTNWLPDSLLRLNHCENGSKNSGKRFTYIYQFTVKDSTLVK